MSWSKTRPKVEGEYHVADCGGNYGGVRTVMSPEIQSILDARGIPHDGAWKGWWWDVAIEMPPKPPPWDPERDAFLAEHGNPDTFDETGKPRVQ